MKNTKQIHILTDAEGNKYTANEQGQLIPLVEVAVEPVKVKQVYSPDEARAVLGISRNSLMHLLSNGQLQGIKAGRRWLIPSHSLNRFLNISN